MRKLGVSDASPNGSRFMELEGLRGVAAVVVIIFHALLMFYPGLFYGPEIYGSAGGQNMRFEDNLYGNPIMGVLTGSFSVAIFFVLSGFVLSVGFLKRGDVDIIKRLAVKRYVRLMLPALASIILGLTVIACGLDMWRGQVAEITHSSWLAGLWPQSPDLWGALKQGLYDVFVSGEASYNPVLWTIKYEFIGSFIVFGVALLFSNSKYRWVVYISLLMAFYSSWYMGFIIGMMLADLYVNYEKYLRAIPKWALIVGVPVAVGLGAFPPTNLKGTVYNEMLLPGMTQAQNVSFYLTVGATIIIMATLLLPFMKRIFSYPWIAAIGKYTFALYLVHMPILFSVGCGVFVVMYGVASFHVSALVSIITSLAVVIPVAVLFEKYIDTPSIKLSSVLAKIYLSPKHDMSRLGTSSLTIALNAVRRLYKSTPTLIQTKLENILRKISASDK